VVSSSPQKFHKSRSSPIAHVSHSSNLLFPKEDKENNELLFACRTCAFSEKAKSSCVMRHDIASSVGDTAGITQDVAQDPTVGLSQSLSDINMEEIPGFCTMCGQEIFCPFCGEVSEGGTILEAEDDSQDESGIHAFNSMLSHSKQPPKQFSKS